MESTDTRSCPRTPDSSELPRLLAELEASGESLAAFARARGLAAWKLYEARRAGDSDAEATPGFTRVHVTQATRGDARLEVQLPTGHVIRVPDDFDTSTLRRVVEALSSC